MNLDDALKTFVIESRELLEGMEESLLKMEVSPDDPDLINAIFRAAHTIKGSAGLFGLDHVVSFTHNAENVLDLVRQGEIKIADNLVALLLEVCDHMGILINHVDAGEELTADIHARSHELIDQLKSYMSIKHGDATASSVPATQETPLIRESGPGVETDNWHISLRFGGDVLRNGLDPIAFIRYLTTFGRIVSIVTLTDAIPPAKEMDPETCYLGFEISFQTDADKATIEGAFEFVQADARISILPPHSKVHDYIDLIENLSGEDLKLGEILVRCGTLTQAELDTALQRQANAQAQGESCAIGEVLVEQNVVRPTVVEAALQKQKQVKENKVAESSMIRVNADRLDEHINLIGELIIASAGIGLAAQKVAQPELLEIASLLDRLVENVRDSALQLRMIQIGATFGKFQRVVRDVSKDLGKDIRLEIAGAETELDKTVIEKIGDPLTHLVRNSMDHGIEPAELRLARGKPAYGTLKLNAFHDSGSIVIEVSDDGGGLDKTRILAKAIERGLVRPDQPLSDNEIYNLIFEPGFSTAEQVNNLSGRGVGMDVVRRNISALRGSVEIESAEGVGSTIRIRLPLTLAIIDGFLVGVGGSSFVLPLGMVVECVELTESETEAAQGRNHLNLRGEVLPFIRLRDLFGLSPHTQSERSDECEVADSKISRRASRENVVVVNYADHRAGLVVEALQGEYQTVIRPLGAVFNGMQGVSGFTILGNGQVALILDVPGLVKRVVGNEGKQRLNLNS